MKHDIKISEKRITIDCENKRLAQLIDYYYFSKEIAEDDTYREFTIEQLKFDTKRNTITKHEYLQLRAALVDIVAQFYY